MVTKIAARDNSGIVNSSLRKKSLEAREWWNWVGTKLRLQLDFFRAFDLATYDILVKKFILYGINRTHIRWLKN